MKNLFKSAFRSKSILFILNIILVSRPTHLVFAVSRKTSKNKTKIGITIFLFKQLFKTL